MGICDFVSPDLHKIYKKKISMAVHDKFYAVLRQDKEIREKQTQAETERRKAKNAKAKEAKISHALDYLINAINYAKKLSLAKSQREQEQSEDFSRWMKQQ